MSWRTVIMVIVCAALCARSSALRFGETFYAAETLSDDDGSGDFKMEVGHKYRCAFWYCIFPGVCWHNYHNYHKYEIMNRDDDGIYAYIQKGMFLDDDVACNYHEVETYASFKATSQYSWRPYELAVQGFGHYYKEMSNEVRMYGLGSWKIETDRTYDEVKIIYQAWTKFFRIELRKSGKVLSDLRPTDFASVTTEVHDTDCVEDDQGTEWCYKVTYAVYKNPHKPPPDWPSDAKIRVNWHREVYCRYNSRYHATNGAKCEHDEWRDLGNRKKTISGHYAGTQCYDGHRLCAGGVHTSYHSLTNQCTCENYTYRRRSLNTTQPKTGLQLALLRTTEVGGGVSGQPRELHGGPGGGHDDVDAVAAGAPSDDPEWEHAAAAEADTTCVFHRCLSPAATAVAGVVAVAAVLAMLSMLAAVRTRYKLAMNAEAGRGKAAEHVLSIVSNPTTADDSADIPSA